MLDPAPPLVVEPERLRRSCDPSTLPFATTAELDELRGVVGQERALEALRFGVAMRHEGYNLFVLGPTGAGKHSLARKVIDERAAGEPVPSDWCFLNNFRDRHKPRALRLPAGRARPLHEAMERFASELHAAIPAAFESDSYRTRRQEIDRKLKDRFEADLQALGRRAQEQSIAIVETPGGPALAPVRDDAPLDVDAFKQLPEDEQKKVNEALERLGHELHDILARLPASERQRREDMRALGRTVTMEAVGHLIDDVRKRFADLPAVLAHLDAVRDDVLEHAGELLPHAHEAEDVAHALRHLLNDISLSARYRANLFVDHGEAKGAPVVDVDNPTHPELFGRMEYRGELGAMVTDFTMLRAGALHRASGGYLMVDARKLLAQPFAWEDLKRCLQSGDIPLEIPAARLGLASAATLEPEPIPFTGKVILLGERLIYYLLSAYDPEFGELFKVAADFEDSVDRGAGNDMLFARLLGTIAREEHLRPFDRDAVARALDEAARRAGDASKLSVHLRTLTDLAREADHFAEQAARGVVTAADVERALLAAEHRADRLRDRVHEDIRRGALLISTAGRAVGQINGLAVIELGEFSFGRPSRITARVRMGRGEITDIEREVDLGGPIHSKGVLALTGFLGARYVPDRPLALSASLVFEQSYGPVEGDSASLAELCALLSALGEVPLAQSLAVTGAVSQHGRVEPVGGVNEKIEGFFDACRAASADGQVSDAGVIIPASNVQHLMLRPDVVAAARAGRFAVYAASTVDEAMTLLTGQPAGERGPDGRFPDESVNARVETRLVRLAESARAFAAGGRTPVSDE